MGSCSSPSHPAGNLSLFLHNYTIPPPRQLTPCLLGAFLVPPTLPPASGLSSTVLYSLGPLPKLGTPQDELSVTAVVMLQLQDMS